MSKQFLHRANVVPRFQQMRCKTVPKGMTADSLVNPCGKHRLLEGFLHSAFMQMVTIDLLRSRVTTTTI